MGRGGVRPRARSSSLARPPPTRSARSCSPRPPSRRRSSATRSSAPSASSTRWTRSRTPTRGRTAPTTGSRRGSSPASIASALAAAEALEFGGVTVNEAPTLPRRPDAVRRRQGIGQHEGRSRLHGPRDDRGAARRSPGLKFLLLAGGDASPVIGVGIAFIVVGTILRRRAQRRVRLLGRQRLRRLCNSTGYHVGSNPGQQGGSAGIGFK